MISSFRAWGQLLIMIVAFLATSNIASVANAQARVLIYGPGDGGNAQTYFPAGTMVTVATGAVWDAMTAADFAAYDLIWINGGVCNGPPQTIMASAVANEAVWGSVVDGRAVYTTADHVLHARGGHTGARRVITNSVDWLTGLGSSAAGGATGVWLSWSCLQFTGGNPHGPADFPTAFPGITISNTNTESNLVTTPAHPTLAGLAPADLIYGQFCHGQITAQPADWTPLVTCTGPTVAGAHAFMVRNEPRCAGTASGLAVNEGSSGSLSIAGATAGTTVRWDLDMNGSFETTGNPVTFNAVDGPASLGIGFTIEGPLCRTQTGSAPVTINNVAPTVTTVPPDRAMVGVTLTYNAAATDPAGAADPLTWSKVSGPTWVSVSSTGVVSGTPPASAAGTTVVVVIRVDDGDGGTTDQEIRIFIIECRSAAQCNDSNECTADSCSDMGLCITTPVSTGTACDAGICDGTAAALCVPCLDSGSGAMVDDGCSAAAPICEGSTPGNAGTGCTSCQDDTTGGTDLGCSASAPVCETNGDTDVCVSCENNTAGTMTDNGCTNETPVCLEPMTGAVMCVECTDDNHCPSMGEVCGGDNTCVMGCNEMSDCEGTALPICDIDNRVCVECLTDAECVGDETCSAGGVCGQPDTDGDGVTDDVDLDDDNDGIPDVAETGDMDLSGDTDDDGIADYHDPDAVTCDDTTPMDGVCDSLPASIDFDQDGIPNHLDLDADGDGIPDVIEAGGADMNGDGIIDGFSDGNGNGLADSVDATPLPTPDTDADTSPDFLDLDADGDGLTDTFEAGGVDADGNGVPDGAFADANNDGLNDNLSGVSALPITDTDGDSIPDFQSVDSDGDGVLDVTEGHTGTTPADMDTDGDGIDDAFDPDCTDALCGGILGTIAPVPNTDGTGMPDFRDVDADDDGIPDGTECPVPESCADSDMDMTPDFRDLDADGDGLPDSLEGHDADHNGTPDATPTGNDTDGDGLDDAFDADCTAATPCGEIVGIPAPTPDLDMDDTPDFQDPDDDGDGITTAQEITDADDYTGPAATPSDVDEDGLSNWYDTDSDGDGTPDLTEDSRPELDGDLDDNGILDYLDPGFAPEDTDGDGILDILECDGMFPVDDTCKDSDMDGVPDWQDVDDDNDGILTIDEYAAEDPEDGDPANDHDWDNDGIPNHLDLDSDNDGIPDLTENGHGAMDADGDGRVDSQIDNDMDGLLGLFDMNDGDPDNVNAPDPINTDGSGSPDYLDLDADDDGLLDILEANGVDADGNGQVDDAADSDMDGLADVVDGSPWPTPDTDDDGILDFQDVDSDGDGKSDAIEGTDADHDGLADITLSGIDGNGNGIDDIFEQDGNTPSQPDTDGDTTPDWRDTDDDGDGVPSAIEVVAGDTDMDGTPDYLDVDDDGDSIPTINETPDPDGDGNVDDAQDTDMNGVPDYLDRDDDGDGIFTIHEVPDPDGDGDPIDARDTNEDGTPDYLDPDDDGDGILTRDEMADPNGDGNPDDAIDSDSNDLPNYLDPAGGGAFGGVAGGAISLCSMTPNSSDAPNATWLLIGLGLIGWRRRR